MPKALINGINLYYEVHGKGETLVLIQGFAGGAQAWGLQIRAFKKHFRVVVLDNRGIGKTERSSIPYTVKTMAADIVALIDYLGIESANILGLSMGGMIAQEVAISYPNRVRKLIFSNTSATRNRPSAADEPVPAAGAPRTDTDIRNMDFDALMTRMITLAFNVPFYRGLFLLLMRVGRKSMDSKGVFDQAAALSSHNTLDRLCQMKAPTLVMTGADDRLISPLHSDLLAEHIPGARLVKVPGGSHAFFFEKAGRFNREVLTFLLE